MRIEFYDLEGEEGTVLSKVLEAVPRLGETIAIGNAEWKVRDVKWYFNANKKEDPDVVFIGLIDKEEF